MVTVGGSLGDRVGRTRILRLGALGMLAGAVVVLVAGLLVSFPIVLVGRVLMGLGAALALPAATALMIDVYTQQERGEALGRMQGISMIATLAAPILAGLVVQFLNWPWIYLMPVAAAVVTLWSLRGVSYTQHRAAQGRLDLPGAVLFFLAVVSIIFGFMTAATRGWTDPATLGSLAIGLVFLVVFVVVELRKTEPLLQVRLLKIRNVGIGVFLTLMRFLPAVILGPFIPIFLQDVMGFPAAIVGFAVLPSTLAMVLLASVGGKMLDRRGPRVPVSLSALLMAAGLAIAAPGYAATNYWLLAGGMILQGAGMAFSNTAQTAALGEVAPVQRGMVSGVFPLAGQFGNSLWLAVITALATSLVTNALIAAGATAADFQPYFAQAMSTLSWIAAAVTVGVFLVTLLIHNPRADRSTS
jgi:MFS family permease